MTSSPTFKVWYRRLVAACLYLLFFRTEQQASGFAGSSLRNVRLLLWRPSQQLQQGHGGGGTLKPSRIILSFPSPLFSSTSGGEDADQVELPWVPVAAGGVENSRISRNSNYDLDRARRGQMEEEEEADNVNIPTTGISVSDEMEQAQKDGFVTEVVPIKGLEQHDGVVAQLVTSPTLRGSYEPVRYLVELSPPVALSDDSSSSSSQAAKEETDLASDEKPKRYFVLVDVPPYSQQLVTRMQAFMGVHSKLAGILITSRDAIHYNEAPGVFATRQADLVLWKRAFGDDLAVIAYRLEIPRDCRESVTQVLDGYGPFAALEPTDEDDESPMVRFVETGRPLTYNEWDHDFAEEILSGKRPPDDVEQGKQQAPAADNDEEDDYSPAGIRAREEGQSVLAIYTPGHSFGSTSYIFPKHGLCFAGYTIPVEDTRVEQNMGVPATGPALDCRGYITTNRAGIRKQMESARSLVNTYVDRFHVVLPARGDPLFLDGSVPERKEVLTEIIDQYQKIGEIYEQLGITGGGYDDGADEDDE